MAIIIQGAGAGSTLRDLNSNTSLGVCSTVSGGQLNRADSQHATVAGGCNNTANNNFSSIGGGSCNKIWGQGSQSNNIGGGLRNTIYGVGITSCSNIGGGACNTMFACESFIGGGLCNSILQDSTNSVVGGGRLNLILGQSATSTIAGGRENTVYGVGSLIGGGCLNKSLSSESVIGGGSGNTITLTPITNQTFGSYIGGGRSNTIDGSTSNYATIGGGCKILIKGNSVVVGGGELNTSLSNYSSIVGGCKNTIGISGTSSFIGGGFNNTSNAKGTVIGGGCKNTTNNQFSVIGGGFNNTVLADYSGVLGGCNNTVTGTHSYAVSINSRVIGNCSVALGGSGINATVSNSVYVPKLNIRDLPATNAVYGLGIDANGFVVKSISPGLNCVVDGILTEGQPTSLLPQVASVSTSLLTGDIQLVGSGVLYDDYLTSFDPTTGIWTCPATGRWNIGYFVHLTGPDLVNGWLSPIGMLYAGIVNFTTDEVYAASTYYPSNIQLYADINGGQWGVQLTAGDQLCVRITNTTTLSYSPVFGSTDYVRFSAQKIG